MSSRSSSDAAFFMKISAITSPTSKRLPLWHLGFSKEWTEVPASTNRQLQNSHGDEKYSIRNTVNSVVITMYGPRWVLKIPGELLCEV